jgi:hypothetical protein
MEILFYNKFKLHPEIRWRRTLAAWWSMCLVYICIAVLGTCQCYITCTANCNVMFHSTLHHPLLPAVTLPSIPDFLPLLLPSPSTLSWIPQPIPWYAILSLSAV